MFINPVFVLLQLFKTIKSLISEVVQSTQLWKFFARLSYNAGIVIFSTLSEWVQKAWVRSNVAQTYSMFIVHMCTKILIYVYQFLMIDPSSSFRKSFHVGTVNAKNIATNLIHKNCIKYSNAENVFLGWVSEEGGVLHMLHCYYRVVKPAEPISVPARLTS